MSILNEEVDERQKSTNVAIKNVAKQIGCLATLISIYSYGNCLFEALALIINKRNPGLHLTSQLLRSDLCATSIPKYFHEKVAFFKTLADNDETKFAEEWANFLTNLLSEDEGFKTFLVNAFPNSEGECEINDFIDTYISYFSIDGTFGTSLTGHLLCSHYDVNVKVCTINNNNFQSNSMYSFGNYKETFDRCEYALLFHPSSKTMVV